MSYKSSILRCNTTPVLRSDTTKDEKDKSVVYLILLLAVATISCATRFEDTKNITFNPFTGSIEDRSGNITLSGPDSNIDMYICGWKESMPKHTHGSLVERDFFTRGNPMNPPTRGAVLKYVNRFTRAALAAQGTTIPTTLRDEQEIFYILSGKGTIITGTETAGLYSGICILIPPGIEFTIKNTADESLIMYLVSEPVPQGFEPVKGMVVKDENTTETSTGHWSGIVKGLFGKGDGLSTLTSVLTCSFSPMTIFHPHIHFEGCEEVWTTMNDSIHVFMGKQIRLTPPGTSYLVPPDGNTPHANFNVSDKLIKMFYFATRKDREK